MKCFNHILEDFYSRYAHVVYRYAWVFIIVPIALTACLSTGVLFFTERTVNETLYIMTPKNGLYHKEAAAIIRNWPLIEANQEYFVPGFYADAKHYLFVMITPKNGRLLFDNETLDAILELDDFISTKFTLQTLDGRFNFTYSDICMSWDRSCFGNGHVYMIRHRDAPAQYNVGPPKIQWPITRQPLTDIPFYLGTLLGQPTINESDGVVLDAKILRLGYFTKQAPGEYQTYSLQWRVGIQEYLKKFDSKIIDIAFGNEDTLNQGLDDTAYRFAPQIMVTVVLVFVFSFACSFFLMHRDRPNKFVGIDWVRSKPLLAIAGIIEPGMAIMSTIGLLLLVGMEYNAIVVVMPFLVLAIGVDDMFIMIAAWHGTKLTDPPEVRFSEALADAAVSISITAVTDVVSFAIGTWNSLPGVQIFCVFTAVAMFFELVYQCTFYAAVMALIGKAETRGEHCFTFREAVALEDATSTYQRRFKVGTIIPKLPRIVTPVNLRQDLKGNELATTDTDQTGVSSAVERNDEQGLSYVQKFFRDTYGPILLHPIGKISALVVFVIYLGIASWGCAQMANGLQPEKLVYKEHYSMKYLLTLYYWDDGQQVSITVEKPPNLTLSTERQNMLDLASQFENTSYSFDQDATIFWLREYLRYLNKSETPLEDTQKQWCTDLKNWLRTDTVGMWILSLRWGNASLDEDECEIKAFRFFIAAKQFAYPNTQVNAVPWFRSIAQNYSQYQVSTFNPDVYPYTDQYLMINPTTIRNSIVSFFVMIGICCILIPNPVCGIFITFATVFIDVGVAGYLSFWGVNMDCVSMITMIMATGIAIDLAAHVSYAYVRAVGTPHERAIKALESLGWPVFQGVTAMFLGVLVLSTPDSYMYQTFFKTVFLVIIFGLMHSIIFLPVALTVFAPQKFAGCCPITKLKAKRGNANVAPAPVNGVVAPNNFYEQENEKKTDAIK